MNELSVLKLFQLSNGDLLFSKHDYSLYKVRKPRMTKLGQGVGVRAHYPIYIIGEEIGQFSSISISNFVFSVFHSYIERDF